MSDPPRIQVIVGSTRPGRFAEKVAAWLMDRLTDRTDMALELVDLRDFPMPFYEQPRPPAYGHREYPAEVISWAQTVGRADGYLIVTPEYNHGYPAALKNALDQVFPEFNRKPVAFASYGNTGGARAIEQLRLVAVELEMAPLRHAIHVLPPLMIAASRQEEEFSVEAFSPLDEKLTLVGDELIWWARALRKAR